MNQVNLTPNNNTEKKDWQTPNIEFISRNVLQSGQVPGGSEGLTTLRQVNDYSHS